jgi:hypothetical protein
MPNTKYSITIIIPMTRRIDPIIYSSLAGSEGMNLFKTNKIIPIIINAIPVSNDTIYFYISKRVYITYQTIKEKKLAIIYRLICYAYLYSH